MPGRDQLAGEFGVSPWSVQRALEALEREGLLEAQGGGRRRRIVSQEEVVSPSGLRITFLLYEPDSRKRDYILDSHHRLSASGCLVDYSTKTLRELNMDVGRVARMAEQTKTDAWIVLAGPRDVLEWFAAQATPSIALFGRFRGLPQAAAGPDKLPAIRKVVRRLVALGHRRIALLAQKERRAPSPGSFERVFLEELEAHGIRTGSYSLPDWEEHADGFRQCIDSLLKLTPPTALIIQTAFLYVAAERHLAQRGLFAPRDISLVCTDNDISFQWCQPSIACIDWDSRPCARRIFRWASNIAGGKDDRRQSLTKARFIEGGTVGPVPEA